MRYMISGTAYRSKRVWVESFKNAPGFIGAAQEEMNAVSIWGGKDKSGANFASWEIDPKNVAVVKEIMARHGFAEKEFYPAM